MNSKTIKSRVIVPGGTGNVGFFIVKELLARGAVVAVPSRSEEKVKELTSEIKKLGIDTNLHTFELSGFDESGIESFVHKVTKAIGPLDAVVATLGGFIPAPSLLDASNSDLQKALDTYLFPHFSTARAFLSEMKQRVGTYIFINGPLAFQPWKDSAAGLVSTVGAAQHMLFRVLAQELEGKPINIVELVNYAYIREKTTQTGSSIPGEATGSYVAHLLSGNAGDFHGKTIHLKSEEQLQDIN